MLEDNLAYNPAGFCRLVSIESKPCPRSARPALLAHCQILEVPGDLLCQLLRLLLRYEMACILDARVARMRHNTTERAIRVFWDG